MHKHHMIDHMPTSIRQKVATIEVDRETGKRAKTAA
jgi:hypothetical protein